MMRKRKRKGKEKEKKKKKKEGGVWDQEEVKKKGLRGWACLSVGRMRAEG